MRPRMSTWHRGQRVEVLPTRHGYWLPGVVRWRADGLVHVLLDEGTAITVDASNIREAA